VNWRSLGHLLAALDAAATVGTLGWLLIRGSLPATISQAMAGLTTAALWVVGLASPAVVALVVAAVRDQFNPPMEL
jgi:membrane protein implicated in regulation of membrane protease activity